jgi:WD40-like Beta Propeller Repeat
MFGGDTGGDLFPGKHEASASSEVIHFGGGRYFPILTGDFAGPPVLSPDGNNLAFVAAREQGAVLLWVRRLNALHARALAGTEGATFPFWSPDGRSLGFFAGGKLKTTAAEGGTPSELFKRGLRGIFNRLLLALWKRKSELNLVSSA